MSRRLGFWGHFLVLLCACVVFSTLRASAQEPTAFGRGALGGASGLSLSEPSADAAPEATDLAMIVTAVELGGIERVDKQTVLNQIRVKAGQQLDPTAVADDQKRIWTMGLFDDIKVGLKMAGPHSVVVRYQVLERPSIAAIDIVGNDAQSDDDIMKVVDLRVNNLYSPNDATANIQKIKDLYIEEGYFLATVRHRTEPLPDNQVKVIFEVQERAEVKVRQIDILGNEGVDDKDIKAVLRTQEGSILSAISKSGNFKRETLETDVQIIQYLYLTKGYIQAKIDDPVVSSLASAEAVLNDTEKDLGVAVADIGAGTVDLAMFDEGAPFYTGVLPVGGNNVTNDIAIGLKTSLAVAEQLKIQHGTCDLRGVDVEDDISVSVLGEEAGRTVNRLEVCQIAEARMREIFELIASELRTAGSGMLPAGLILTGGGAQMAGVAELGRDVLQIPVRVAGPIGVIGLTDTITTPAFSTAIGLLRWGAMNVVGDEPGRYETAPAGGILGRIRDALRSFFP